MGAKSFWRRYDSSFYSVGKISVADAPRTTYNVRQIGQLFESRDAGFQNYTWRKQIREHVNATTRLTGEKYLVERKPAYGSVSRKFKSSNPLDPNWYYDTIIYRGYPVPVFIPQPVPGGTIGNGKAESEAVRKFYKRYSEVAKSMDGLVAMGEMRETLRMLRNPAKSLFDSARNDYLRALKRRKARSSDWKKGLAGAWLEWVFGVQPLLSDIKSAYDGLERLTSDPVVAKLITTIGKAEENGSGSQVAWRPDHEIWFSGHSKTYLAQKVKLRGLYLRKQSEIKNLSQSRKLSETFGLTLSQFVPAAWELMPWSFLIDYFSNVGDVLEQSFTRLENLAWINKTLVNMAVFDLKLSLDRNRTATLLNTSSSQMMDFTPASDAQLRQVKISFVRDKYVLGVNPLMWEIPGSTQKWLNIAALGVQANEIHPQRYSSFKRRA